MKNLFMIAVALLVGASAMAQEKPGVGPKSVDCAKILSAKKAKQQGQADAAAEDKKPADAKKAD